MQRSKLLVLSSIVVIMFAASVRFVFSGSVLEQYRADYRIYRKSLSEFELARESYLKLKTLSARDQAAVSAQQLLSQSADVLNSYFYLLRMAVKERSGFELEAKSLAFSTIESQREFYPSFKERVSEETTLSGLEALSLELGDNYSQGEAETQFIQVLLTLARLSEVRTETDVLASEVKAVVEGDLEYPERERILGEWLTKITQKVEGVGAIQEELWEDIRGFSELTRDYERKKFLKAALAKAEDSQVLILQVVSHLLEIIRRSNY